jgi:hypothetical protein
MYNVSSLDRLGQVFESEFSSLTEARKEARFLRGLPWVTSVCICDQSGRIFAY